MKLVTMALQRSYTTGEGDVSPTYLEDAAAQLTHRRDTIAVIDGQEPKQEGEDQHQASLEASAEPKPGGTREAKRSEAGNNALKGHRGPPIRNKSEPSSTYFLGESSDKDISAQYLRPNIHPIYQLNLKVKYRESFRPFAPSVLREEVGNWFDLAWIFHKQERCTFLSESCPCIAVLTALSVYSTLWTGWRRVRRGECTAVNARTAALGRVVSHEHVRG